MAYSRPIFCAFKRPLSISVRTLFELTPNRLAASVVPIIFMGRLYHP